MRRCPLPERYSHISLDRRAFLQWLSRRGAGSTSRDLGVLVLLLLHELRGAAPKRSIWRTATFETIRCTFLKIAVRIQELKTRIKMALPSSYPHVQALTALATSIAALAP